VRINGHRRPVRNVDLAVGVGVVVPGVGKRVHGVHSRVFLVIPLIMVLQSDELIVVEIIEPSVRSPRGLHDVRYRRVGNPSGLRAEIIVRVLVYLASLRLERAVYNVVEGGASIVIGEVACDKLAQTVLHGFTVAVKTRGHLIVGPLNTSVVEVQAFNGIGLVNRVRTIRLGASMSWDRLTVLECLVR